eukprot:Skav210351  [mRNA]  locus=scaffold1491:16361:16843:+ [translate_table: standard]
MRAAVEWISVPAANFFACFGRRLYRRDRCNQVAYSSSLREGQQRKLLPRLVAQPRQQRGSKQRGQRCCFTEAVFPNKTRDAAHLFTRLKDTAFGLQAEQTPWNNVQQHVEECKAAGQRLRLRGFDLQGNFADVAHSCFERRKISEWPLQCQVPVKILAKF